jgi:hypothetical protein
MPYVRARSFYGSQQGGIDQRSLSFQAIPGTDKRIRLCVAFSALPYPHGLSQCLLPVKRR